MKIVIGVFLGLILILSVFISNASALTPLTGYAGKDINSVPEHSKVTLFGSGKDPLKSKLFYKWRQLSGEKVVLSASDIAKPSFTAPEVADGETKKLVFELTVSDETGRTAKDTVFVNVISSNNKATNVDRSDVQSQSGKSQYQTLNNLLITKSDVTWTDKFWSSFKVSILPYDIQSNPKIKNGITQEFATFYDKTNLTKGGIRIDIMEFNDNQQASEIFQSLKDFMLKNYANDSKNSNCYLTVEIQQFQSGSVYACAIEKYFVVLKVQLSNDSTVSSQDVSDQIMNIITKKINSGKIQSKNLKDINAAVKEREIKEHSDTKKDSKSKTAAKDAKTMAETKPSTVVKIDRNFKLNNVFSVNEICNPKLSQYLKDWSFTGEISRLDVGSRSNYDVDLYRFEILGQAAECLNKQYGVGYANHVDVRWLGMKRFSDDIVFTATTMNYLLDNYDELKKHAPTLVKEMNFGQKR